MSFSDKQCSHCFDIFENGGCKSYSKSESSCVSLSERWHCSTNSESFEKCYANGKYSFVLKDVSNVW